MSGFGFFASKYKDIISIYLISNAIEHPYANLTVVNSIDLSGHSSMQFGTANMLSS